MNQLLEIERHDAMHDPAEELRKAHLEYGALPEQLKLLQDGVALYIQNNWPKLKNPYSGKIEPVETDRYDIAALCKDAADMAVAEIIADCLHTDARAALRIMRDAE